MAPFSTCRRLRSDRFRSCEMKRDLGPQTARADERPHGRSAIGSKPAMRARSSREIEWRWAAARTAVAPPSANRCGEPTSTTYGHNSIGLALPITSNGRRARRITAIVHELRPCQPDTHPARQVQTAIELSPATVERRPLLETVDTFNRLRKISFADDRHSRRAFPGHTTSASDLPNRIRSSPPTSASPNMLPTVLELIGTGPFTIWP